MIRLDTGVNIDQTHRLDEPLKPLSAMQYVVAMTEEGGKGQKVNKGAYHTFFESLIKAYIKQEKDFQGNLLTVVKVIEVFYR